MITIGGNAELELVDSMDPFAEGIIFSVMPPKKSWRNISNLSGGEKVSVIATSKFDFLSCLFQDPQLSCPCLRPPRFQGKPCFVIYSLLTHSFMNVANAVVLHGRD